MKRPLNRFDELELKYVIGGTTSCVVAARLSNADPNLSILVVERGPDNWNDPTVTNPLLFMENILNLGGPNPRMSYYHGQEEPSAANRAMVVPVGNVLGGGSSVNMLTYTRAQREDLDGWKMPGWSADEMLPYMKKVPSPFSYFLTSSKPLNSTESSKHTLVQVHQGRTGTMAPSRFQRALMDQHNFKTNF